MTVTEDVLDRRGRVLVPAGAELSQRTLDALEGWGVEQIKVDGEDDGPVELDPLEVEAAKAQLKDRFRGTDIEHPFVAAVLEGAARNRVRAGGSQPQTVNADGT